MKDELVVRINEYLGNGGLFNPEMMDHEKVRDLILEMRDYLVGKNVPIAGPIGTIKMERTVRTYYPT